jgi:4-alpha-glucanotransferase
MHREHKHNRRQMKLPRASGILLHPTSLPGPFGIGDIGPASFDFIDFLAASGQTYWQILPLGPTGPGNSPYSTFSAFAGNTLLVSPEKLMELGLLADTVIAEAPQFPDDVVDYGQVYEWKTHILKLAFENFRSAPGSFLKDAFARFCSQNSWWLDDYAAYRAIKFAQGQKPWFEWAEPLRLRVPDALQRAKDQLDRDIEAERFHQFLFFSAWHDLKSYANDQGITIIGDIPIFVALDSADVWCNQSQFKLNEDGRAKVVAGVPPDYFSRTGQLWGNPIYDWEAMGSDDFSWWTARIAFALSTADIVRLDHFIGFVRNWEVPGGDATAENGRWVDVPGQQLFTTLHRRLGPLPVIAEDLGSVTTEVDALRDRFEMPGMRILQYAFGGDSHSRDLPHNYIRNTVAYTGTHDNDTSAGWYRKASKHERQFCRKYLHARGSEVYREMIRAVFASVADTAIVPVQDLLGLPSSSRMNTPATSDDNWQWRLREGQLTHEVAEWLSDLTGTYGRHPQETKLT